MTHRDHLDERRRTLLAAAEGIANHLPGWALEPDDDGLPVFEGEGERRFQLAWPPGVKLARATGHLPPHPDDSPPFLTAEMRRGVEIRFNPRRAPKTLARDIQRRLLPGYEKALARHLEHRRQIEARAGQRGEIIARLASVAGVPLPEGDDLPWHQRDRTTLRLPQLDHPEATDRTGELGVLVHGEELPAHVRFELDVPTEVAERVLRALYPAADEA